MEAGSSWCISVEVEGIVAWVGVGVSGTEGTRGIVQTPLLARALATAAGPPPRSRGGPPPGTTTADFQRQQMAEGLDGLEPAGPQEAASAAATKPSHNAPKPQNSKAATDKARSVDSGSAAAAADRDSAMVGSGTEEGEVGTVDASNGNLSGKVGGSSNGGPVAQNGAKRRRGQMHARSYGNRTASPEPSARGGGNGRADGATEAPSLPSVIAGASSKDAQCRPIPSRTMHLSSSVITCSSIPNTATIPDKVQMHECSKPDFPMHG